MVVRLDHEQAMAADMHTWYWEAEDKIYKKPQTFFDKMAEIHNTSEIQGGYWKGTTAIGVNKLEDRDDYGKSKEGRPMDGFTVYASIKSKSLKLKVPYEVSRDMVKTKDYLKDYVSKYVSSMILYTKELIVANLFLKGGLIAGHADFNQNNADMGLSSTYTNPNLAYDGKPPFALVGNEHTAKNAATYSNAIAVAGVDYTNTALPMFLKLTADNAYREDGQPFDNSGDIIVMCAPALAPDWQVATESPLNPDDDTNKINPLKGLIHGIYGNPYMTTATMSVMMRRGLGFKVYFSDPIMDYWEDKDPKAKWFSIGLEHAECLWNFRTLVSNNAPVA